MVTDYTLIRSSRKTIALQLKPDGSLVVRAPRSMKTRAVREFVASKEGWIASHRQKLLREPVPVLTQRQLEQLRRQAAEDFPARAARLAPRVGVSYGRVTIRCQRTRWGSCSGKGNLNFNCLLMLAPEAVRDYVVLHELCHRREMNHSPAFWALVEQILPNYREPKKWLKDNGPGLLARLPAEK